MLMSMDEKRGSDPSAIKVFVDSPVRTADDEELGRVAEVQGDQFKVDAPQARDFWLDVRTVLTADEECTELAYDSVQIEEFKLESAGATAGSPILADELETFESEDEQARRREDMKHGYR